MESKHEVLRILEEGSLRRTTAATKMNASSSRSHTVFTITVTITEKSIVGQGRELNDLMKFSVNSSISIR